MGYAANVKKTFKLKYCFNYIGVAAFLVLMVILSSTGALSRSGVNLLPKIAYSIILAVSLNLVVGFLGELSLGHAGFMCVGAYLGSYFSIFIHNYIDNTFVCFLISLVVGGLLAAVFGFIIGLPALRLKGDYLAIVTLAFGEIVRNVFKNLSMFGGAMGLKTDTIKIQPSTLYIVAFILVLIVLFLIQNLIRSKHGRAITAIRDNEIAAKAMGINVTFYKLFVFEILVMVVIGGIGSISGSIIAATLITYINFLLQNNLSGDLAAVRLLVYALILIVVVIFNNAPALKPIKDKFNFKAVSAKLFKKKESTIVDDDVAWNRIESKINMDELLSVDVKTQDGELRDPDKPTKEGK